MPINYQFFQPTDAAKMGRLEFVTRQVVEGAITGQHKSPHKGFSVEFAEHREYVPGDELRHMDWRAYARSDRYYVKLYEQETNLRATIVLDTSGSMKFGEKFDYARKLAACLAYLLARQQDLAGLCAIDDSVRWEIPPASSPAHLDRMFRAMETLEPGNTTDLPNQLHGLAERLPRRSMVILLSDLWVDPGELIKSLQHLRYRKHQGMILHLIDRAEVELPYDRMLTFQDLETNEKIQVDPAELRETYKAQVLDFIASIRRACTDSGMEYHDLFTDMPYDKALVRLMSRRG
ncbi:MAG TPA: DUF58 domain-containing protein [Tepidisphaeraceae bacterium]|jgi:uncharacterized protein (DUF58 family)|nr:DUF58 domain-containing protein [Tepidisphaeraceae bacterium]